MNELNIPIQPGLRFCREVTASVPEDLQHLIHMIGEARDVETLKTLHQDVQGLVDHLLGAAVPIRDLVRLIACLNDQVLLRLMDVIRSDHYPGLTDRCAFVVLGSQGRGEQTLTTDQDSALIYADDLAAADVERLAEFCREVVDALVAIGIPYCPGDTMASNEFWRRSCDGWRQEIDRWFSSATLDNIINVAMFCDMRTLYGDPAMEREIKEHIAAHLGHNDYFLIKMAANVHRISLPLDWMGHIKTEVLAGERQGQLDIKRGGIFTITEGVKVLALESKILDGGTLERIQSLVEAGVLTLVEADNLREAYDHLIALRLRFQVESLREGQTPDNIIFLERLNGIETECLHQALQNVRSFQRLLKCHFRLELFN